jgi:hypothetical protein
MRRSVHLLQPVLTCIMLATTGRLHVCTQKFEMINNIEWTDGIDRYVINPFDCGVLDDVTVDSNAQPIYV